MKKINFNSIDSIGPAVTPKSILKTILFMIYMYGLVVVTPYLLDGLFSMEDLFTWLKPVLSVIFLSIVYGPLVDKIFNLLDDGDNDKNKDKDK